MAAEIIVMHHLFYAILCFYLMLFCQNVAAVMSWAENDSVRECELVFVFSCAVIWSSIARTNLCFPFLTCPFNASVSDYGERWYLPPDEHRPSYQPPRKIKQNGMHTKMPANTRKNADFLYKFPPSLNDHKRKVLGFCTDTLTEDVRVS